MLPTSNPHHNHVAWHPQEAL